MNLHQLPSVERLLQTEGASRLIAEFGRPLTVDAVRASLESARAAMRMGAGAPGPGEILLRAGETLHSWLLPTLRPAINATGVIVHTNLGRAPLCQAALDAMQSVAAQYSTLEYDLEKGGRSKREQHVESLLQRVTGAEAALAVTNNAAAVLLALTGLARRRAVIVSRSQLVEIGGGFRVPDVMKQSGAKLIEVGTTNRTHLRDFESAIDEHTAAILVAHHSNFKILGFTAEPGLEELSSLARKHGLPLIHDLGSGALLDTALFGLGHEPTVQESLQAGASLVTFSGDKLLGGPQAGILVGDTEIIERLSKHPLARAVRTDKLCLAALSATLAHYLKGEATEKIPVWKMISAPADALRSQAEGWRDGLGMGEVLPSASTVGGGSLPEETLPTWVLGLKVSRPDAFLAQLRSEDPPVIARIDRDCVLFDPRTVLEGQDQILLRAIRSALGTIQENGEVTGAAS